jgi:hypothetical protein
MHMITRVAIPMLLLPLLAIALPLLYLVAWLREAIGDLQLRRVAARAARPAAEHHGRRR